MKKAIYSFLSVAAIMLASLFSSNLYAFDTDVTGYVIATDYQVHSGNSEPIYDSSIATVGIPKSILAEHNYYMSRSTAQVITNKVKLIACSTPKSNAKPVRGYIKVMRRQTYTLLA